MKKAWFLIPLFVSLAFVSVFACGMGNQYSYGKPVMSESQAKQLSLNYLATVDDKTMKVNSIDSKPDHYVVMVANGENERVAELFIDKRTGTVRSNF